MKLFSWWKQVCDWYSIYVVTCLASCLKHPCMVFNILFRKMINNLCTRQYIISIPLIAMYSLHSIKLNKKVFHRWCTNCYSYCSFDPYKRSTQRFSYKRFIRRFNVRQILLIYLLNIDKLNLRELHIPHLPSKHLGDVHA